MKGALRDNPVLALALGLCPSLAITTQAVNAIAMGVAVLLVLVCARLVSGLLDSVLLERSRAVVHILVVAILTTGVYEAMGSLFPALTRSLGIYVPLIAFNCLILDGTPGEARGVGRLALDALGMGIGFTLALLLIAVLREALGAGTITLFPLAGWSGVLRIPVLHDAPLRVMTMSVGAFLTLGYLRALFAWIELRRREGRT